MKTAGVITLTEVLREMGSGATFSITYTTADRKKGSGGALKTITQAQKVEIESMPDNILKFNKYPSTTKVNRNPNHWDNKTRNIYVPSTRRILKVHIKLINIFNGKKVLL